jgi:hypothetical protein
VQVCPLRDDADLYAVGVQLGYKNTQRRVIGTAHAGAIDTLYFAGRPRDRTRTKTYGARQETLRNALVESAATKASQRLDGRTAKQLTGHICSSLQVDIPAEAALNRARALP